MQDNVSFTVGKTLDVLIDRVNDQAWGESSIQGVTVLVPLALPGELIHVEITEVQAKKVLGKIVHIVAPHPERITPACPVFNACGGCDLQMASAKLQVQLKEQWVKRILHRCRPVFFNPIIPAQKQYFYRNRITVHHDGRDLGFHQRGSHTIVPVNECCIADAKINAELRKEFDLGSMPRNFELKTHDGSGFRQVNDEQNLNLINTVLTLSQLRKKDTVLELYSGSGNFTFAMQKTGARILAVEGDMTAANLAAQYVREHQIKNIKTLHDTVLNACFQLTQDLKKFDVVVADPPRAGLLDVAPYVARLALKRIVLVSCDLKALARDAQNLIEHGWIFLSVTPIDMFPQTKHIECVSVFERSNESISSTS